MLSIFTSCHKGLRVIFQLIAFLLQSFQQKKLQLRLAMLVMGIGLLGSAVGQATVTTDKPDYAPRSNAVFTGSGFTPGETVRLKVKNLSRACNTIAPDSSYMPWTVTADANGGFVTNWTVCDCNGDSLRLRATGQTSNDTAYAYFTDAANLSNLTIGTQNPALSYGTGGTVSYSCSIKVSGNPNNETVNFTFSPLLPAGVTANSIIVTSNSNPLNFNLVLNVPINTPITSGTYTVTATSSGGGTATSSAGALSFVISKSNQTITFVNPGTKTYGDADFNLGATASSGLAVSYTVQSGPATIVSGNMLHITGAGSVTVRASQIGDANYNAAPNIDQTFTVLKAPTTTAVSVSNATYDGNSHGGTANVTGVNSLNQSLTVTYVGTGGTNYPSSTTAPTNAGTYDASATYAATANYLGSTDTKSFTIDRANSTIVATGSTSFTYNAAPQGPGTSTVTGSTGAVTYSYSGTSNGAVAYGPSATKPTLAGSYSVTASVAQDDNYNGKTSDAYAFTIDKRPVTITPNAGQFKYCGQPDPTFNYTGSEVLISGNFYSGALGRSGTNDVGTYAYTIGTLSAGNNYSLSLGGSNSFEIRGITIDASASSVPVASGSTATLKATVSPAAEGIPVVFKLDNGNIGGITTYIPVLTNTSGIATLSVSGLPVELYLVTATAGSGCATSTAYLPVYDPNGGFVTGGGWINSPAGAYVANSTLTGKANFGFVAKYKKGSNAVDGNTEFQFNAGNFNFKSNLLDAGTLVISGAKATYRGVGTVNGSGNYGFMVTATDGDMNGGGGTDRFRIKIWDKINGNNVVYDNQMGAADNADALTALGGGSIVIHDAKSKGAVRTEPIVQEFVGTKFNVKVLGNPSLSSFQLKIEGTATNEKITIKVVDMNGRMIEMKQNLYPGQVIELGSAYRQGTYFAEVTQGDQRKVVKLIKIGQD